MLHPGAEMGRSVSRFGRKPTPEHEPTKLERRIDGMATEDVVMWGSQSLNNIGRALDLYRADRISDALDEAEHEARALLAVVEGLKRRGVR